MARDTEAQNPVVILPHFTTSNGLRFIASLSLQDVVYQAINQMIGTTLYDVWTTELDDGALIDAVKNQTEDGKRLLQLIVEHRLQS